MGLYVLMTVLDWLSGLTSCNQEANFNFEQTLDTTSRSTSESLFLEKVGVWSGLILIYLFFLKYNNILLKLEDC